MIHINTQINIGRYGLILNKKPEISEIIIVINAAALLRFGTLVIFMNSKKSYPNEISGV